MVKKLANPQQEIYQFITDYTADHQYPPSVREICAAVGLKSTATVYTHLKNLEKQGLIFRDAAKKRTMRINRETGNLLSPDRTDLPSPQSHIPLVGSVAAGLPILATENIEEAFPLPAPLLHGNDAQGVFMLRVEGDSMHNAGIFSGDILVVHKGGDFENGDIVVARLQGENATVKRIFREKNRIRLQPENDLFNPIYAPGNEVEVAGKVIGLLRTTI